MAAGTESVEWVTQEFARADLRDKRLDRRLLKTAEHLAKSPASPINEACGNWVSKDELIKALWPRGFVDESNLTKHIWFIRRALGNREQDSHFMASKR